MLFFYLFLCAYFCKTCISASLYLLLFPSLMLVHSLGFCFNALNLNFTCFFESICVSFKGVFWLKIDSFHKWNEVSTLCWLVLKFESKSLISFLYEALITLWQLYMYTTHACFLIIWNELNLMLKMNPMEKFLGYRIGGVDGWYGFIDLQNWESGPIGIGLGKLWKLLICWVKTLGVSNLNLGM